ncbi:MAG: hypothetical protein ABR569_04925 [Gaiellaceae bacterium]
MGRATSLLGGRRLAAFAALGVVIWSYYIWRVSLPNLPFWWDVALLVFPIIPGVLALPLLLMPLWRTNGWALLGAAALLALTALLCQQADYRIAANFAKLFAPALVGWWFLRYFESLSWVVLVACLVPIVDAYSVWRGPTHQIVTKKEHIFTAFSFAFPVPHQGTARLGLPDLLFFALFLAAADRFQLRVWQTFALTALSFGATVVLADAFALQGLPALPLLSVGFLGANCDLLWRRRRGANSAARQE